MLSQNDFVSQRRSPLLGFPGYQELGTGALETIELVGRGLSDPARVARLPPDRLMTSTEERAWASVDHLHLQFSAGSPPSTLQAFVPVVMQHWDEYAHHHEAFHQSPLSGGRRVPHIDLQDLDYWKAIRLTSFALLLGHSHLLSRLVRIWDYENEELDGLLERLIAPFVPNRAQPPDTCTRHLPYFKLLKVFTADPTRRPTLMAKYLDEWYTASRREPYFNSHTKGRDHSFLGYWSFEAAAVAYVLDIDDTSFREHEFYPKDLADFAESLPRPTEIGGASTPIAGPTDRLRCIAGQACPREGMWFTPARADSRRHFASGEVMPEIGGSFGATIWQYDPSDVS